MKKLVVVLLLCTALNAQAQTYDWEVVPGLFTSWTVYTKLIKVAVWSENQDIFCDRHFILIQNGMVELSAGKPTTSDSTAFMVYRPGYENCGILYPGMVGEAVVYQLPGWFDLEKAFRIIYVRNPYDLKLFDIPQEPRLITPEIPHNAADNATCALFATKNLLGFRTRNTMQFCAWTATYGATGVIFFHALVTSGTVTLDPQDITLLQGEKIVASFSYWADNSTDASVYCPDCNREMPAGTAINGAIYKLPLWWDWSRPFTLQFQGQNMTVNDNSTCAATYLLGADDADIEALRRFRDQRLAGSALGQQLMHLYYRCSPRLIAAFEQRPQLRSAARSALKRFAAALQ